MKCDTAFTQRFCDTIERLVDDRMGIIRGVTELPNPPGAPGFFHYAAEACKVNAFQPRNNFREAGGASFDRRLAMAKAIGEAVERYCSAIYLQEECPLSTADSAPFPRAEPSDFALFSMEQYAEGGFCYVPFTGETLLRWTEAVDLVSKTSCYIPACMVYVPYYSDTEAGEQSITQPISTGLACHGNWEDAAISAICEVIERDAFTITWQAMMSPPCIRIETLSERNRDLVERFEYVGDSVHLFNMTFDHGVPCILSVMASSCPQVPALAFAAASAPSPEEAVRKSLEELAHTRRHAVQLKANRERFVPQPDYSNVINQETHVLLFTDQAQCSLAEFLFTSESWADFQDLPDISNRSPEHTLRHLINAITSQGHRILLKDLTTPDVQELGFYVVRAVIPGFHPLFMGYKNRALGGKRLWTVPQMLGYQSLTGRDNPAPHPFP
ncbi:MAG: YcaO-like family protein [Nitrospira sp.]